MNFHMTDDNDTKDIDSEVAAVLAKYNETEDSPIHMRQAVFSVLQNGPVLSKILETSTFDSGSACNLYLITLADYKKEIGDNTLSLQDDEILVEKIYGDDLGTDVTIGEKIISHQR